MEVKNMGYIYKITNKINNKSYIGKTEKLIELPFKEHIRDSQKQYNQNRPLYRAFNKYGIDNFIIEELGEYLSEELSKWEIYWIGYYDTYKNGYNATLGGEGKTQFDRTLILQELKNNPYPSEIAKKFNCSRDTVINIAKANHIKVRNKANDEYLNINAPKKVAQYDLKTNEYIQTFSSVKAAIDWCVEQHLCSKQSSGARSHISEVANGTRKSAYKYKWKYI